MEIPLLSGIYTDQRFDYRVSYPLNMLPVALGTGISDRYFKPAPGIVPMADGPGIDLGGINWNGACYRVMGSKLVRVAANGAITTLGDMGAVPSGPVTFDYSFDRLGIGTGTRLFYWNGTTFSGVTDPDLGPVLCHIWVDGYFMTTDGSYLVVTELNDPMTVNPLKYGSSEIDPDPIKRLLKVRNEPHAVNRYTIEVFENVGGELFPFRRIDGAQIHKGAVGTHACCVFNDAVAFVGSGRNEAVGVYLGANAQVVKLSTAEVDRLLAEVPEYDLSEIEVEAHVGEDAQRLYVHLPTVTLAYDAMASQALKAPVWYRLGSGLRGGRYRARHHVRAYDRWLVGDTDSARIGYLDDAVGTHWGDDAGWELMTPILYNENDSAILHRLELTALTGRIPLGLDPVMWTSYSQDGQTWSIERGARVGRQGERNHRLVWLQQGMLRQWRVQRFRGTSESRIGVHRLDAEVEALSV